MMYAGTLNATNTLYTASAMFSAILCFSGAMLVVLGKIILHSLSVGILVSTCDSEAVVCSWRAPIPSVCFPVPNI